VKGIKMKTRKECLKQYNDSYNTINTALGGIVNGKIDFCGLDVIDELSTHFSQTEAFLIWALGRRPTKEETKLMDTFICMNIYPDMRIWCIRTGAYAAALGSPLSACFASAQVVANSQIFGVGAAMNSMKFLQKLYKESKNKSVEEIIDEYIKNKVFFGGFGRPLIQGPDERYVKLTELLEEWEYSRGPYLTLLDKAVPLIKKGKGLFPNYGSIFVALLLDPPFCFDEARITVSTHYIMNFPSYLPACEIKERGTHIPLLPLKVSDIIYTGKAKRGMES
jgi:hypothetical protein